MEQNIKFIALGIIIVLIILFIYFFVSVSDDSKCCENYANSNNYSTQNTYNA